jgi:hypothetical protein
MKYANMAAKVNLDEKCFLLLESLLVWLWDLDGTG